MPHLFIIFIIVIILMLGKKIVLNEYVLHFGVLTFSFLLNISSYLQRCFIAHIYSIPVYYVPDGFKVVWAAVLVVKVVSMFPYVYT